MEITLSISHINWVAVLVATVVAFGLGALWYSPLLFGKKWTVLVNLDQVDRTKLNMPMIFGAAFALNFICATALDLFIGTNSSFFSGAFLGFLFGTFFVGTSLGVNYLFALKPLKLYVIDVFYYITNFILIGAILGIW